MKILLAILGLAALVVFIRFLMTRGSRNLPDRAAHRSGPPGELLQYPTQPKAPPSSAAGDPLEMIRAALPSMSSQDIQHLLDMGATLKPGAEELFKAELERRQAANESDR